MTVNLNDLIRLTKPDVKPASEVLARVFQNEPVYVYFVPDASERSRALNYHFALRLRHAISNGEVYATSRNLEGLAIWFPPDYPKITLKMIVLNGGFLVLFHMGLESVSRQMYINNYLQSEHERNVPFRHWYLSSLGVDDEYQGKGYVSVLLKPMLARFDKAALPCYLETQKEENVSLYQHFGFSVIKESIIPGTSITIWLMLRKPSP